MSSQSSIHDPNDGLIDAFWNQKKKSVCVVQISRVDKKIDITWTQKYRRNVFFEMKFETCPIFELVDEKKTLVVTHEGKTTKYNVDDMRSLWSVMTS